MLNLFQRWRLRSLVAAGRTDDAMAYLRARGLSKGESTIALAKTGMDSDAAILAVHQSPVWRDRHEADAVFHESLGRAVDELQQSGELQGGRASVPDIEVQHKGVKITIADPASVAGGKPTPAAVRCYEAIVDRLDETRRYAASALLSLYNDTWRDEDHGVLDTSGFAQHLTCPSLTVYEEGMTLVYFEDGDMFGGHCVQVTLHDGVATDAVIVG